MITASFLNEVASYTDERIAKVVLNQTYEITKFEIKQVADGSVTLQYLVPQGAVSNVTLIELKAADGTVISSNPAYVPIKADTILVHTVTFKEAS